MESLFILGSCLSQVISTLRGHDDKIRVVLNKADQVSQQQLMRVYGALMWSLGKVFRSPEVCRVYIGSFNVGRVISEEKNPHGKELFEKEQEDLLHDLYDIPRRSCDRKASTSSNFGHYYWTATKQDQRKFVMVFIILQ